MLDALLSLAQSDNFVHEVAFKKINLCELVVSGCRRVEDLAESSGILLDWHLPDETIYIEGDECCCSACSGYFWTTQFAIPPNLARFEPRSPSSPDNAFVTVRDTGVGMSEDVRHHVFNRFYQADLRERKSKAGSGLGLSIGRWIADAHGAELTVESTPHHGSVFQIRFPVKQMPCHPPNQLSLDKSSLRLLK